MNYFNQYSLSQSHLYNVENLQIIEEMENTLEAPVSEFSFGQVMVKPPTEEMY